VADGTKLHADVLRPAHLPADARTPVILSIGPYFKHSGQTGVLGPAQGTPYTPEGAAGPSARFYDFINGGAADGARLHVGPGRPARVRRLERLPRLGGAGEQADVKAAVEWAANQPWSTGQVGMYGKSYDGVTG
jgi:predicted acyl esterase